MKKEKTWDQGTRRFNLREKWNSQNDNEQRPPPITNSECGWSEGPRRDLTRTWNSQNT